MRKLIACGVALVAALALTVPGALGSAEQQGITAKSITIGGTFPLSGPLASYAPIAVGIKAYISYINARRGPDGKRGIYGRQVTYKAYDDQYNQGLTLQLTRRLVEDDKVFATVGQLGTEHNINVRPYMNQRKVPHTLLATGASYWGTQYKEYPWTIGWQADYIAEARVYGLHIKANQRGKKIAILYQNDDYGKDYLYGLRAALGKAYADANIVAQEPFEATAPNVTSQMIKIRASGAEVFVIFATPPLTIAAYATARALGYRPDQVYQNSVSATAFWMNLAVARSSPETVSGTFSVTSSKDPANPAQANDPAVLEYKRILAKYAPGTNPNNGLYIYGFGLAETFVQAMYKAGKNPTQAGYMSALLSLDSTNRFLLNGVKMKTSRSDHFIVSQMRLQRFNAGTGAWTPVGGLIEGRPR